MFYACFIEKCDAGYFFGFGQVMKILSHILSLELCLCKLSRISGCLKDERYCNFGKKKNSVYVSMSFELFG